ncbi:LacI family transcriptional regulator [Rhodobacteraceae bacterium RKSG542]|uniref:LacI family DNA-binding transcriptional regulator n=1 Tax=Pseudovibrio flavus TaxID=2529854 RepID=UPI0012BD0F18|nr:LacI family DNA-binding transcriptional regulator [Pseudovibrio flavus]MTI16181.1 LacI family transcriptional regulator [Pseudovibrio flavus]
MKAPVTLKDIAEHLQVSTATVSRSLSGDKRVTEATRLRVQQVAEALDYRPNVIARSLRTKRTGTILLVVRDIKNPFYLDVLAGVETAARQAGYSVLMCNCDNDRKLVSTYVEMLRDGRADGMVLMSGKLPKALREDCTLKHLPVVLALEAIENVSLPLVQIDNVAAAEAAVEHLISLGHRHIAHVCGPLQELMSQHRLIGYRKAMAAAGLDIPAGYEANGTFELISGEEAAIQLMNLPQPPTAIFFSNDEMALGANRTLKRLGYRVPEDVSLVGFDNLFWSEVCDPPLTTIHQPRTEVGQQAFALLHATLVGDKRAGQPLVLPTELRVRASTAAPKQMHKRENPS